MSPNSANATDSASRSGAMNKQTKNEKKAATIEYFNKGRLIPEIEKILTDFGTKPGPPTPNKRAHEQIPCFFAFVRDLYLKFEQGALYRPKSN